MLHLLTLAAFADDPAYTLGAPVAATYDTVDVNVQKNHGRGVVQTLAIDGTAFLHLRTPVQVAWSDTAKRLKVDRKEIHLAVDGKQTAGIGYIEFGLFREGQRSLSASRPFSWKDKKEPYWLDLVFPVPAGTRKATLVVGEQKTDVAVPKAAAMPHPKAHAAITINSAKLVDTIPAPVKVGDWKADAKLSVPGGKLLQVELVVTPKQTNKGHGGTGFFWHSQHLAVKVDGKAMPLVGEDFGGVNDGVSHNPAVGKEAKPTTAWFAVPSGAKSYELLYLGEGVGTITP